MAGKNVLMNRKARRANKSNSPSLQLVPWVKKEVKGEVKYYSNGKEMIPKKRM